MPNALFLDVGHFTSAKKITLLYFISEGKSTSLSFGNNCLGQKVKGQASSQFTV